MRSLVALLCGALAGVGACGSERPAPVTPLPSVASTTASPVTTAQPAVVLSRSARGASREEALARVTRAVQEALVGPEWASYVAAWQPALPSAALSWSSETQVEANLSASTVEGLLLEFEVVHLAPEAPPLVRGVLLPALVAERAYLLCQQRQALLAQPCTSGPPTAERESVAGVMSQLVLEPDWPDGVPVDATGKPLWPARIRTWRRSEAGLQALSSLPIRVEWSVPEHAAAPHVVKSDATGLTELPLLGPWERVGIRVDNAELLGPLAGLWPGKVVELLTRPLDKSRMAVVVQEATPGEHGVVVAPLLLGDLGVQFEREPLALPEELAARIETPEAFTNAELRTQLAESTQGQVDYVLLVNVDSEFASRMGTDRTWYEAHARVHLVELWTARLVEQFDVKHTEVGIGDARANEAARRGLANKLARRFSGK